MALAMDLARILGDTVIANAIAAALTVVLVVGAWQKLRDRELFLAALDNYRLLPDALLAPAATLLPLWELAAGALLLPGPTRFVGAALTAALLATVTGAVAINLLRGHRHFDCGCNGFSGGAAGDVGEQQLSWALVVRNLILILALAACVGENWSRPLVWFDYFSVAFATLALLGLYVSANQLMANHPRLQALRNH